MSDLSKIVYLSAAQYETLKTNGTITVGGTTINYSNDDLYLTPDTTVPSGGSSGQFLAKASSTDYDTVWTGLPAAGYNSPGAVAFPGGPTTYGINKLDYGGNSLIIVEPATTANITARAEKAPITPTNLNHAVKSALTDTNHLTMTSAEQGAAQSVLGVPAIDASNLSSTNVSSWASALGVERVETIYDMSSIDSSINWGYTTGIPTATEIGSKDFSQYKYLKIYFISNYMSGVCNLDLTMLSSYGNRYNGNIALTSWDGSAMFYGGLSAYVNSGKTSIRIDYILYNDSVNSNGRVYKIEGVY